MAYAKPVMVKAVLPGVKKFVKKFQLPEPPSLSSLTIAIFDQIPFLAEEDLIIYFTDSEGDNVIISNDDDLRNALSEYKEALKQDYFRITLEIPQKPKPLPSAKENLSSSPIYTEIRRREKSKSKKEQHRQRAGSYKYIEDLTCTEVLEMRSNLEKRSSHQNVVEAKKCKRSNKLNPEVEDFSEIFNDPDSDCILSEDDLRDTSGDCVAFRQVNSSMHGVGDGWHATGEEQQDYSKKHRFTSEGGLKADLSGKSVLDVFFSVFTLDIIDFIIQETNKYHAQHQPNMSNHRQSSGWEELTRLDLLTFLTLLLLSGHHSIDRMKDFWTSKYFLEYPFFRSCMSRERFFSILSYLHFCDNNFPPDAASPWYDRAWKVRPVLNMLLAQFQSLYEPEEHLIVDQFAAKYKGCVVFNQHIPKNAEQGVLKLWKICDSKGYTYDMLLYTESNAVVPSHLLIDLANTLRDKGHTIITDKSFTTPTLYRELTSIGFNAVGAVDCELNGMPDLLNANMKQGEVRYRRNYQYQLLAVTWKDREQKSTVLSTFHRGHADGVYLTNNKQVAQPESVSYYKKYMNCIGRTNRTVASHSYIRKSWKWSKKLFFHLFDLSIVNCYVLYGLADGASQKLSVREFRLSLIEQLLSMLNCSAVSSTHSFSSASSRLDSALNQHWPEFNDLKKDSPNQRKSVVCIVCKSRRIRKKSTVRCEVCKVTLCPHPCFQIYHTQSDFGLFGSDSD